MPDFLDYNPTKVKDIHPLASSFASDAQSGMAESTFHEKLRKLFDESGLTKAELARQSNVSYDIINKLLRGENRTTSPENTAALARVLGQELLPSGFSAPPQPRIDVLRALEASEAGGSSEEEINKIRIAWVDDRVQVAGTYDREGLGQLIHRLNIIRREMPD